MPISKNSVKNIKFLHQKKFRLQFNKFIVEGDKIVKELIQSTSYQTEGVYAIESWIETNAALLAIHNIPYFKISLTELKQISGLRTPNMVVAVVHKPDQQLDIAHLQKDINLYLDNLQDPGNLGTIIRIADWYRIKNIIISPNTVDVYNGKVLQATMGSFLRVNVVQASLKSILSDYNLTVYGTMMDGKNLYDSPINRPAVIVIGNEGRGLSEETVSLLNQRIAIPAYGDSLIDSLNAAVATGIICAEFRRRLD